MKYKYNGQWVDVNIKALDSMPIGSIISFAGEDIPTGWLVCDGNAVASADYSDLYNVIGTKYGGNATNFNLPDFRGRVPVGLDPTDQLEEFDTLGNSGGSKTDNLSNAYAKVGRSSADYNVLQYKSKGGVSDTFDRKLTATGNVIGGSSNTITDATELGGSVSTLQPYLVVNFIIKAKNTTPTMASIVNTTNDSTEDAYSCDYVNKLNTYSTTEQRVGTWIDGKPIYRKVVSFSSLTSSLQVPHNINNFNKIINIAGYFTRNDVAGASYPLTKLEVDSTLFSKWSFGIESVNATNIKFSVGDSILPQINGGYIIFEYTKTTD